MRKACLVLAFVIGTGLGDWAPAIAAAAQPPPMALTDTVNDFAGIIDSASRAELDRRVRALRGVSGDTIVIATVQTFKPYGSIDEYAVKLFENGGRGIGDKGKDNGLLIVVAVDDRALKLEVGYGLEGIVPDGFAGQVRDLIRPYFRQGQYGQGLLTGTTALITRIADGRGVAVPEVSDTRAAPPRRGRTMPWGLLFWVLIFIIIVSRNNRSGRRRYWGGPWSGWTGGVGGFGGGGFGGFGGGGGGGGFGGFGGGGSGGGGASGSW